MKGGGDRWIEETYNNLILRVFCFRPEDEVIKRWRPVKTRAKLHQFWYNKKEEFSIRLLLTILKYWQAMKWVYTTIITSHFALFSLNLFWCNHGSRRRGETISDWLLLCISMCLVFSSTFLLFLNFFLLYLFVALFVLSFFFASFPSHIIRFYSTVFYLFIFNCFLFFSSFLSLLSLAISD